MKPSTPKGTRDFSPAQMRKREYLFDTLRKAFRLFGYAPIETPAMENLTTLTGKYGEEGDQLLFKVLNNGDFLKKADAAALERRDSKAAVASLSKRGLRYDLTVPFARFVVQHQNDIAFPFKRYAIQPVWRADRPQKGRYQEFYQCDADVVGSDSLVYEAELMQLFNQAFTTLGLKVIIRINHRGILQGLLEVSGIESDKFIDFVTVLDKLDKIGKEKVIMEMAQRGISEDAASKALSLLQEDQLGDIDGPLSISATGSQALSEIRRVEQLANFKNDSNQLSFSPTLARGLSYYTGCIFEVEVDTTAAGQEQIKMGSIAAGGRYANLTEAFGGKNMPGVGISFGAERIYDVLEELNRWPDTVTTGRTILLAAFDDESLNWAFAKTNALRAAGIAADCYPDAGKPKKPLRYADQAGIPYIALIGDREVESETLTIKHLASRDQKQLSLEELAEFLSEA